MGLPEHTRGRFTKGPGSCDRNGLFWRHEWYVGISTMRTSLIELRLLPSWLWGDDAAFCQITLTSCFFLLQNYDRTVLENKPVFLAHDIVSRPQNITCITCNLACITIGRGPRQGKVMRHATDVRHYLLREITLTLRYNLPL